MQQRFFSIIVVSLNAGERLRKTLDSIMMQSFKDYEVIIKDGCSTDDSVIVLEAEGYFKEHQNIHLIWQKDAGIYDGMNQALSAVSGRFVQFLNCGDSFYDEKVLSFVHDFIMSKQNEQEQQKNACIFYGNQYNLIQQCTITSSPKMNDFACFRNVPCHQVCFYDHSLFEERGYLQEYTVRADYEHFLYCCYSRKAEAVSMPYTICFYEGGGYSETRENKKCSKEQHKKIVRKYLGKKSVYFQILMILSLSSFRTFLAESKTFSGFYNKLKSVIYHLKS